MVDDLRAALERAGARLSPLAARVVTYDTVGSTNDEAARLASAGAPEGTLVIAGAQTSGRGRSGHAWFSPPGSGLYVSVVLRPEGSRVPAAPPAVGIATSLITLAAGVAVAEGIRRATALPVELKWPNDVVMRGSPAPRWRKLAGILTEASATGARIHYVIVGFGINVRRAVYPPELDAASSLEAEAGRPIDRDTVLVEALEVLREQYVDLLGARQDAVLRRWRALAPTAEGASVAYEREGRLVEGTTAGLMPDGALAIRRRDGAVESVISGEVRWM